MTNSSKAASARGGFHVKEGCCISCGVPQAIAPEVVAWTEGGLPSCYWIWRAGTAEGVGRAIRIIRERDLGWHRDSGNDPTILRADGAAEAFFRG
jgi:hypothetical protein